MGPEAYLFTALTLIEISKKIIKGDLEIGFQTPYIYMVLTLLKTLKK